MTEEVAEQTWLEIDVTSGFESKLNEGRERFLVHAICHALDIGRLSAEDFIRHFPPSAIMEGLKDRPTLRAKILNTATGVKGKPFMPAMSKPPPAPKARKSFAKAKEGP